MEYLQYNVKKNERNSMYAYVLNLVISGIPSILIDNAAMFRQIPVVLNLVISGIPSIRLVSGFIQYTKSGFKPCYKWNTFNTKLKIAPIGVSAMF